MLAWDSIFMPTEPLLELVLRGTITYLALVVLLRVVGRREAGGLGVTDLLVVLLVVDVAGTGLRGGSESIGDSAVMVLTVLAWSIVVDAVAYRWPRLGGLTKAHPRPLIEDGELNLRVMRRELMTREEVFSQLRLHGITDATEVSRAYIEPNGMVSVIRRDGGEPDLPGRPQAE